ncbi:hypothetical protein BDZ89DRAFT_1072418 [Hymenopellis radicata]|nr:hypothetical protein BDZ89DRAFT_1072418 [Hymenopellis radicata]
MSSHATRSKLDGRVGWDLFRRSTAGGWCRSARGSGQQRLLSSVFRVDDSTVCDAWLTRSLLGLSPEAHDKGTRGR